MHRPTFPFAPTKTYGPISLDLREKRREKKNLFVSLSLYSRSHPSVPPLLFPFDFYSFFLIYLLLLLLFSFPYYYYVLVLSFPLFPPLVTWLNVNHSHKCTTCHVMCHPTPGVSKNVKFRLSRNLKKFNKLILFRETNPTAQSVSSSDT